MQPKNYILTALAIISLITLGGCARYKAHPLRKLVTKTSPKSNEQTIAFAYHHFSKSDCMCYLDRNVIKKGYQPILMTFTNNTDRYLTLSKENFSMPCASTQEVAKAVHTNTTGRWVGYGVVGLFIWPFLIPAVVDGIGSSEANHELDADFAYKALQNQIIAPCATVSGLIFVPNEEVTHNFSVTLIDQENGERFVMSPSKPSLKI